MKNNPENQNNIEINLANDCFDLDNKSCNVENLINPSVENKFNNSNTYGAIEKLNNKKLLSEPIPFFTLTKIILEMGLKSFGGNLGNNNLFYEFFVEKYPIITDELYDFLFTVCSAIPGPTIIQFLISIMFVHLKSVILSIFLCIVFNIPSLCVTIFISKLYSLNYYEKLDSKYQFYVSALIIGFRQGILSISIKSCYNLFTKLIKTSYYNVILAIISMVLYYWFKNITTIVSLLILYGFLNWYFLKDPEKVSNNTSLISVLNSSEIDSGYYQIEKFEIENTFLGFTAGILFLITTIVFFSLGLIFKVISYSIYYKVFSKFYLTGMFTFTATQLPLLLYYVSDIIPKHVIINAYVVSEVLPGAKYNMLAFIGTYIDITCGIFSWIFGILPGILILFTFLKYLKTIRKSQNYKKFVDGMGIAIKGFLLALVIVFWNISCIENKRFNFLLGTINSVSIVFITEYYKLNILFSLIYCPILSVFLCSI